MSQSPVASADWKYDDSNEDGPYRPESRFLMPGLRRDIPMSTSSCTGLATELRYHRTPGRPELSLAKSFAEQIPDIDDWVAVVDLASSVGRTDPRTQPILAKLRREVLSVQSEMVKTEGLVAAIRGIQSARVEFMSNCIKAANKEIDADEFARGVETVIRSSDMRPVLRLLDAWEQALVELYQLDEWANRKSPLGAAKDALYFSSLGEYQDHVRARAQYREDVKAEMEARRQDDAYLNARAGESERREREEGVAQCRPYGKAYDETTKDCR